MAISVSFNGATLYRPGSYSKTNIDLSGNVPLGPAGLVAIFGESDAGTPGASEVDISQNFYTADRMADARAKYRSGPIVDALSFLFSPASDGNIPNGAQTVWVYKTNASTRAQVILGNSYGTVRALEWGVGGNQITYQTVLTNAGQAVATGTVMAFDAAVLNLGGGTPVTGTVLTTGTTGLYWDVASTTTNYRVWYQGGTETAPPAAGRTLVMVTVVAGDAATAVVTKTKAILDALTGAPFWSDATGSILTVARTAFGTPLTPAAVGTIPTTGTLTIDPANGVFLNGRTFQYSYDGEALQTVTLSGTAANHNSLGQLVIELNGLTSFNSSLIASASAGSLVIKSNTNASLSQEGAGESLELLGADLARFGQTAGYKTPSAEPIVSITLDNKRDVLKESADLGGHVVLTLGRDSTGGATSASVTINATSIVLTDSVGSITLDKAAYNTIRQLADAISLQSGWTAALTNSVYNQLPLSVLDQVAIVGAFSASGGMPARVKKDAFEVQDFFASSGNAALINPAMLGLPPVAPEAFLAGGTEGASTSADMVAALAKFEKFHVNSIVPLFSRDASADIADGLTDPASTYTIDGVHQAVKTHISLMKTTKKRSERQGYLSFKGSYEISKEKAGDLADARLQLMIQDIRQSDASGTVKWFQPYAFAALMAGARGGAPVGLPMTFKFLNCSGIRQTGQSMLTAEADIVLDFDPDVQYDDAIISGITFMEAPRTGGFRVVLDNTTYGVDDNFVFNRANVLYAADVIAYNFRNTLEQRYIGAKNTVRAAEVKATAESVMATFLAQGITVSTPDAPQGFKNMSVRIEGNTIYISVTIKIVEGIDFILSEITIQRATQTA